MCLTNFVWNMRERLIFLYHSLTLSPSIRLPNGKQSSVHTWPRHRQRFSRKYPVGTLLLRWREKSRRLSKNTSRLSPLRQRDCGIIFIPKVPANLSRYLTVFWNVITILRVYAELYESLKDYLWPGSILALNNTFYSTWSQPQTTSESLSRSSSSS